MTVELTGWQITTIAVGFCAMVAAIVWAEAWVIREAVKKGQKIQ